MHTDVSNDVSRFSSFQRHSSSHLYLLERRRDASNSLQNIKSTVASCKATNALHKLIFQCRWRSAKAIKCGWFSGQEWLYPRVETRWCHCFKMSKPPPGCKMITNWRAALRGLTFN